MVNLLINSTEPVEMSLTSFGGKPVQNSDGKFQWPTCGCCKLPMQFLAKILVNNELHQIFMCQNDPGMCDDWDANGDGNAVVVTIPIELEYAPTPSEGITLREVEHSVKVVEVEGNDYEKARNEWAERNTASPREVLGQVSGEPSWIQGDEIPTCNECNKPMKFVAQLEQGPDWKTEMNFGGGVAYLFHCDCIGSAKFLWQC